MKKLLYILIIPITLLLVNCGGGEEIQPINPNGNNQNLSQIIIDEIWEGNIIGYGEIIFELKSNGELIIYDYDFCEGLIGSQNLGNWSISGDSILYTYNLNGLQIDNLFGVVTSYNSTEIQIYYNSNSTSICNISNLSAVPCTYVPDNNFEQRLIDYGWDDKMDDYVKTSSIETITSLNVRDSYISDLTGIEDFTALTFLKCDNNQLTSLDVSMNTNLERLESWDNGFNGQAMELEIGVGNTNLIHLECSGNQITSLDLSTHINLTFLDVRFIPSLSSLDLRNGNNINLDMIIRQTPNLTCVNVDDSTYSTNNWSNSIDSQHYFSEDCP
jgi:Leucine-rich repeat (LRR) protein